MHREISAPLVLSNDQVSKALDMRGLITALERAFRAPEADYNAPPRWNLARGVRGALVMPCQSTRFTGVKVSTWTHEPGRAPRVIRAHYSMYELESDRPVLFCEADMLTEMRTAAVSALATDILARRDVKVLGIFGTGRLAHEHLRALRCVRPFEELLICGSSMQKSQRFAEAVLETGLRARAVDAEECASFSDVICTCTTSATPLFDGRLLRAGTHINAVGAFHPDHRELDSETVRRSALVVDCRNNALVEAGEIVIPIRDGIIDDRHILADLPELVKRGKWSMPTERDITVFKSLGMALEDMVAAELLLERSKNELP